MLGSDGSALKKLPGLAERHAKPKQGAECETPHGYTRAGPKARHEYRLTFKAMLGL